MTDARDPARDQLRNWLCTKADKNVDTLTTGGGQPIGDKLNAITAGPRGPMLMQDTVYLDEMAHFDRERIPERVVHAKGAGAFGFFEVTHDISRYCKAKLFHPVGKRTSASVRFSTVAEVNHYHYTCFCHDCLGAFAHPGHHRKGKIHKPKTCGESGSADTVRDPRGFACKFYTEDGNWDLTGNNTPIFFIRDPLLFPSFIHTQKRNPQTHLKDADMTWDFFSLRPETLHQVGFLYSDRGIPDGYRHMNGYGSHTFKLVNDKKEAVYCKFHLKTNQGIKNLTVEEARQLTTDDPDYSIRDLYNAISTGNYPSWSFYIQVMTFQEAQVHRWNPFDLTKVWPHKEFPLIPVGQLVLNKNPINYFTDVEQIAFDPNNMPPGIEPSPDKMLQGRLFAYPDTHRHRLGANYLQLPVNCPFKCRVTNYQRDGPMCSTDNQGGAPNYYPNSFGGPEAQPLAMEHSLAVTQDVARYNSADDDDYSQVTTFYLKVLNADERRRLCENIAAHLKDAQLFIQNRMVCLLSKVHPDYGAQVRTLLEQYNSKCPQKPVVRTYSRHASAERSNL